MSPVDGKRKKGIGILFIDKKYPIENLEIVTYLYIKRRENGREG